MPTENRSSNTEQMVSAPFRREDRYIVIKRKDLAKVPVAYRSHLVDPVFSLLSHLPRRECLVIESDWPEHEPAWAAIEARVTGRPTSDGFSAGDLADQGAKAFRDGVTACADLIQARMDGYLSEFGAIDPGTGSVELPRGGDEYVGELQEIIDGIRSLPLPQ